MDSTISPDMDSSALTFGVLYPGEMGSAICRALHSSGRRAVTTLDGRGPRTESFCQDGEFEVLATTRAVVSEADVIVSVVPPRHALSVAETCSALSRSLRRRPLYLDVNSISPAHVLEIQKIVSAAGIDLVDGSIHGPSAILTSGGIFYVSGPRASELALTLGEVFDVRVVGSEVGAASLLKLLLGGLNKGLVALFLEVSLTARAAGLLDDFLARCRDYYPDVLATIARLLPTYPRHAARRGDEMLELEETLKSLMLRPGLIQEAGRLLNQMGRSSLEKRHRDAGPERDQLEVLIELIAAENPIGDD